MNYINEAKKILAKMTLTEKIGQMNLVDSSIEKEEELLKLASEGKIGAYLTYERDTSSTQAHKKLIEASLNSGVGVPILFGRDVIHGHWTMFPIGLGMAASFNAEMVEKAYKIVAKEASDNGIYWTFTPMMDISRDPRWGRIAEGFGEDTYLSSRLAEASVWGLQGRNREDLGNSDRILSCPKHFIGYGACEGGRDANTVEISLNTLLNIYFPPFVAAIKAGAGSIMSGYHDLNGEPVSASKYLLETLIKKVCDLDGFIVSDAGTTNHLTNYRFAEDRKDASGIAANSGIDMDMMSSCFIENLEVLVKEGKVSEERIDDAVIRILAIKLRLNLWNRPISSLTSASYKISPEVYELAVDAARQAAVLLVNKDSILPLSKDIKKLYVTGPFTDAVKELYGTWVIDGIVDGVDSISQALKKKLPNTDIKFNTSRFTDEVLNNSEHSDYVLFLGGESPLRSGERNSIAHLNLPDGQEEQIISFSNLGKKVILVIVAGRPLNLTRVLPYVSAILYVFHPGTGGGEAIARILTGEVEPGGRLPVTFPRSEGQIPLYYNSIQQRKARACQLKYIDITEKPLFNFGYGLTYTSFKLSNIRIQSDPIKIGESAKASILVTNTGEKSGEAVLQCYIQDCVASLLRPAIELKGFKRVKIPFGESVTVEFLLGRAELGFYNQKIDWIVEPGKFKVFIGTDCENTIEAEFNLV
ncbi:glycoside hydrolase family 3 C-terminal domain-containing protein [Clostridium bowmanii]|uniref:glycoside hydrolase family 3 N-terminal domain-containing protein n=1 Tax=Clostridium bowmanii TaxID=132925 RepID=UPI001C0C577B|nr:glycoside hydrolase family 3 N-terminal domain-containing protein [Clostridium bowmanii]MBU3191020.1 glycoside hydrolase family 3 C-terminal domain-containing protein [Clostridium bowmanii]MCA1075342.1 glycoside hydrolase family 3 C-terminal domain-containing protein [Clostridium bowmanii]